MGVFSAEGYSPDLEKIQGISEMDTTPDEARAALIPRSSKLPADICSSSQLKHWSPLQALLKKENCFAWDENTNTCFQKIKSQLQKALLRPLRYYDWTKLVTPPVWCLTQGAKEPASSRTDSPLLLQASPSQTPRPTMPTLRENSWPSYMVVKNSIHTCMEGHSSWRQTISPLRWSA